MNTNPRNGTQPTVVLIHRAFPDSSSWTGVIERLQAAGVAVTALPNPLRGIRHDSAYVASAIAQIPGPVLAPRKYPTGQGAETAVEFAIDPAHFREAFAADLPAAQAAVMAATQRPPAWKTLPSWAVVATGDKAAGTDIVRSMAERVGAEITEVDGSHVVMISQPQAVADVILKAIGALS